MRADAPWLHPSIDWLETSVGSPELWPEALVAALGVIGGSRIPMVITWGPERLMFYNAAYAPILSGKPEAMGRPLHQVFAESWPIIGDIFRRAEAGKSVYFEDFPIPIVRDGQLTPAWWSFSYSPLVTSAGEIGGVLCVVYETTRTTLAEAREKAGKDDLRRVTDLVPSLLWRADGFGRTVWQNGPLSALAAIHGAEGGEVWKKIIHPDDLPGVLADLAAAKAGRRAFCGSLRLKVADEEYRWHQVHSEPALNDVGVPTAWFGVATDIQDIRDAAEALDQREALAEQFAANSSNLLWAVNLDTLRIDTLSHNFDGVWPGRPTPWSWPDFMASVHEADRAVVQAGFDQVANGELAQGRFRIVTATGDIRRLEGTTFPIRDAQGHVTRMGGILKDVTPEVRRVVHLIDDEPASRNRLSQALRKSGLEVVVFSTVADFARIGAGLAPAPILYRHRGDGDDLARLSVLVRTALKTTPWLVVQAAGQPSRDVIDIMKMGACDIVEADAAIEVLAAAVATARSLMKSEPETPTSRPTIYRLTAREKQVLEGLIAGGTNKTIAQQLKLSHRTVESHRASLMERLGVDNLAELVALATQPSFKCQGDR